MVLPVAWLQILNDIMLWCYLSRYYICYNSDMVLPFQILCYNSDVVLPFQILCNNSDMVLPFQILYMLQW